MTENSNVVDFVELMTAACRLDCSRSQHGHTRITRFEPAIFNNWPSFRIYIIHRTPDDQSRKLAQQFGLHYFETDILASKIFRELEEMHDKMDSWAFRIPSKHFDSGENGEDINT